MVPLVLNGDAGEQQGMVAGFFRRVARHFANEVAVVTPNGKLLSHDLDEGLAKWKALDEKQRRSLEDLGPFDPSYLPAPPADGMILAVYSRALARDGAGRLAVYKTEVARSHEPGRDRLWLTADEVRASVPNGDAPGESTPMPESIVERICRRALVDLVRVGGNGGPRRREEVLARSLVATITAADDVTLTLRLEGSARLATHDAGSGARGTTPKIDDFTLAGRAVFDRKSKRFTAFNLVAYSETGHYDEIHKKTLPLAFVLELSAGKTPMDRTPPSGFGKDYFEVGR